MDSLKYTNIEQYYIYYDLTNKPTSRPIRLFVYHLMGLLLVGLSGSKQTMFMNMFVYRTPWQQPVPQQLPLRLQPWLEQQRLPGEKQPRPLQVSADLGQHCMRLARQLSMGPHQWSGMFGHGTSSRQLAKSRIISFGDRYTISRDTA
jgi:hypothetical protein